MEISAQYQPGLVEKKWYKIWMDSKVNHGERDLSKKPFTIVIPPPNITGALHMGHALNNIIQDIFIRKEKKSGLNTCWIPGTDHGGIATQNVIEKQLLEKGLTRHDIGREKFLELMWEWRHETGDTILMQLKKLGCLCDWERTRFTMDTECGNAVFEAFKILYNKGLIYRGNYMVNWCPRCHTALSDIEVEYKNSNGNLWYIKYPFKDDPKNGIIVATTRPETMLGDTAVAVNPSDKRYKNVIGKTLLLPIMNREIPLVADKTVEKEFGTGAVKITPSHDPNDYALGSRHNLESITVIDKLGKMTEAAGKYNNQDRYTCRKNLVTDLEENGYLVKVEKYINNISTCYRCHTVIEPLVSDQWYLNTKEMAKKAIKVVKDKKVTFLPETWEKPYLAWMENLHDWCISRQIWWGHRIPIWYCSNCYTNHNEKKGIIISKDEPKICPDCNTKTTFVQDEDVLDTWFSSSLWPFSTLGWPEDNKDLDYFYPTSVLATGHEILYLWVARMIMMGVTLKGDIPFDQVYIHGIVRDGKGKKMSKSLGNVIDPLGIIEKFGTDALRFSLTSNGIMGRDLQVSDESFISSRNFCNKLWNASRLILMNLETYTKETNFIPKENLLSLDLELSDKWILTILQDTIKDVLDDYRKSDFASVARTMYEFTWNKYCDWYLESVKSRLYSDDAKTKKTVYSVLIYVLKEILNLLHPIIPFITEEISENINKILKQPPSLLVTKHFPESNKSLIEETAKRDMERIIEISKAVRNIKGEMRIPPSKEIELYIKNTRSVILNDLELNYIKNFLKANKITQSQDIARPKKSATAITPDFQIYVPLENIIDLDKEEERLKKELKKCELDLENMNKKLANKNFTLRAPKQEIEKTITKKETAEAKLTKIKQSLKLIKN